MAMDAARRVDRAAWALCCIGAGLVFLVYYGMNIAVSGVGQPLMPLDDAYIHFQYARQIAGGQFYVYNPGLPPTSGATSFIYPYLLAAGYLIGFQELSLGLWALILGALALALSAYLVYRLAASLGMLPYFALAAPILFLMHGLVAWHYMSGMETGIAILFTLLTIRALVDQRHPLAMIAGSLLALTRPEGAILALLAAGVVLLRERRLYIWCLLPLLALGVQPAVNLLVTGSAVASGNSAKSLFGMIPFDLGVVIGRIAENFVRMWRDFASVNVIWGDSLIGAAGIMLVYGLTLAGLALTRRWLILGLLTLWAVGLALSISTLDTAFWHFRRYQMPLIAVFFPLLIAGAAQWLRRFGVNLRAVPLAVCALPIISGLTFSSYTYARAYAANIGYVRDQPLAMARWLNENTPPDAVIAVHDVGMMRYIGGRTTLDMVGLTTPGAADYWRNGPGAVGEFLDRYRPDYIASYGVGHGLGLGYLENSGLYGQPLAEFRVQLDPEINVALAADRQAVYRPTYYAADGSLRPQGRILSYGLTDSLIYGSTQIVDWVDVADIQSERAHQYTWRNARPINGFPSEYYDLITPGCDLPFQCRVLDGGRRINGEESFIINARRGQSMILITRVHAVDAGEFDVYVNDVLVGTRVIPALPGSGLQIPTFIHRRYMTESAARIRIVPRLEGDYMPYFHWAIQGFINLPSQSSFMLYPEDPFVVFQDGAIEVYMPRIQTWDDDPTRIAVSMILGTRTAAHGDYKLFFHVLDEEDRIVSQRDQYPGDGSLPPGNWMPTYFGEEVPLWLPPEPGRYRVAFGLYNPYTFERLIPYKPDGSLAGDEHGRFIIGEVEISGDG
jgi:hypothetical protein